MQVTTIESYDDYGTLPSGNAWSCQQNNANNAYYVTIPSGTVNNTNKTTTYAVVPVAELERFLDLLFLAEADCWRNKKRRMDAARFHYKLAMVFDLAEKVCSRTYKPTTSICFVLNYPRYREVFAANYKDRVVHHLVAPFILSVTERVHTANGNISHGNRPLFSALTAAKQIQTNMAAMPNGYVAKMDVSGFFMNIDRRMAYDVFVRFCKEHPPDGYSASEAELILHTLRVLIEHDPTSDCKRNSPVSMWNYIAANKTLFGNNGKGLPIGNFYSQLIANLVLAVWAMEIIKRGLPCKITQFVDDMCIVAEKHETIKTARKLSEKVLQDMSLRLHPTKYYIQPIRHGVQFCGRVIYRGRLYINNRTVRACKNSIKIALQVCSLQNAYRLCNSFNSYGGFMCHCRSWKIQRELAMMVLNSEYCKWLYFEEKRGQMVCRVFDKYKPHEMRINDIHEIRKKQKRFEYEYKKKCSAEQRAAKGAGAKRHSVPVRV